ncbi:MAG TPA: FkbM family methyltransferase [Candidatus Methanoperedens sp.]|nr:FkbM family methyltransferase [Candidatus Methanoperedens sp.]
MKLVKTKIDGLDFWYRKDDKFIGQRIALGKYEQYETALMVSQINSKSVCVDVGANVGYYTFLMARRAKRVFAFEPDKECFEILKKNVSENNLKNVTIFNLALSNKKEKKYLIKDCDNLGNSRIDEKNGLLINTDTLDNLLINEQIIDLIKIDVQGWETEVIDGAKKIIERDRPTLFLEYTPSEYDNKKMINFLKNTYQNIFSINDFVNVPWPIYRGVKIIGGCEYTDLFLKNKMNLKDYVEMIKNVKYKKFIKGIINLICQK